MNTSHAPTLATTYTELPAVERRGCWFHLRYRPLDGFRGYKALRNWLGLAGFRTRDYHGLALDATISAQQELAGVFLNPYVVLLSNSAHADRLAAQLGQLEVRDEG